MRHRKDGEREQALVFLRPPQFPPTAGERYQRTRKRFSVLSALWLSFWVVWTKSFFRRARLGRLLLSSLSQKTSEKWLFAFVCGKQHAKPQAQIPAFGQPLELCTQKTGLNRKCSEVRVQRKKSSKQASYSLTSVPACVLIYCVKHGLCTCVDLFTTRLSFSFTWSVSREEPARVFDLFPSCDQ